MDALRFTVWGYPLRELNQLNDLADADDAGRFASTGIYAIAWVFHTCRRLDIAWGLKIGYPNMAIVCSLVFDGHKMVYQTFFGQTPKKLVFRHDFSIQTFTVIHIMKLVRITNTQKFDDALMHSEINGFSDIED